MEDICKILKLKRESVERSLAELLNRLSVLNVEMCELIESRNKYLSKRDFISRTSESLRSIDLQMDSSWQDQIDRQINQLKQSQIPIKSEIELVKTKLCILSGKVEMLESQIKASNLILQNERIEFDDKSRLEIWRISNSDNR